MSVAAAVEAAGAATESQYIEHAAHDFNDDCSHQQNLRHRQASAAHVTGRVVECEILFAPDIKKSG